MTNFLELILGVGAAGGSYLLLRTTISHPFVMKEKEEVFRILTKKPIIPSAEEIKKNPRARSAKLRISEKL